MEVGALGTPTVEIELDALDASEAPLELRAVTMNVYEVEGLNPVIGIVPEPAWERVAVIEPGVEVAVYEIIVDPPSDAGAVKSTVAVVVPVAVAVPIIGAPGATTGLVCAATKGEKLFVIPQT